jgi:serine/threonine protein kinase
MTRLSEIYRIHQFIDTFALGHYARVLDALDRRTGKTVAYKVLRPEHLLDDGDMRWEYRAFGNEATLLHKLADSPSVVKLLDCGYLSDRAEAPMDGDIVSFQSDVMGFVRALSDFAQRGWRPYLALEHLPRTMSLFYAMRPTQPNTRWRLPSEEGIALALQFAQLLRLAHRQGIVYLDHKLEHVYWDGTHLRIIDFNSSRYVENGGQASQDIRRDIHNLCVGVLYPIFTGMSPQKTQLRPQPSSRDEVEARYQDITELDFNMEPLLSRDLQALLQAGAAMRLNDIDEFIADLQSIAAEHGWDFPDRYTNPASRDARDQMRAGLKRLREGEAKIREARDLFREAAIHDGISADLENELRRLVKLVNELLNKRVIP